MEVALAGKTAPAITGKTIVTLSLISVAYLFISFMLVGFKGDQLVLLGIVNISYCASALTRKFITGFSIFLIYWIIFDYMKAFPNYNYNPVHIANLYNLEKHLFGININGKILTPNEYWRYNRQTFLDVLCGFFYLCWIPVPILFAIYLFFTRRRQFILFSMTFVLVNFIGFFIYYTYPAAPPWYVQYHGFTFIAHTPTNIAGLARFDNYFHIGIFKFIYTKGSNVFAAMPSLHSSYPVVVLYYGLKNKLGAINLFFGLVTAGIWFAAVYLGHHYILDVLAGLACAAAGISLFNLLLSRSKRIRRFINDFEKAIV